MANDRQERVPCPTACMCSAHAIFNQSVHCLHDTPSTIAHMHARARAHTHTHNHRHSSHRATCAHNVRNTVGHSGSPPLISHHHQRDHHGQTEPRSIEMCVRVFILHSMLGSAVNARCMGVYARFTIRRTLHVLERAFRCRGESHAHDPQDACPHGARRTASR
jgi:hypothetical protein